MTNKQAKNKVTVKKHNGDDAYSYAVFLEGRVKYAGLTRSEAKYYKAQVENAEAK